MDEFASLVIIVRHGLGYVDQRIDAIESLILQISFSATSDEETHEVQNTISPGGVGRKTIDG